MSSVIKLDVGTNFDIDVLDSIIEMNRASCDVKVTEVYGSLRTCYIDLPSARPDFRLSDCNRTGFEKYVDHAKRNGISVNYAVNAPFSCGLSDFYNKLNKIIGSLKYLEQIGVERVIVSNPLLMEIISNYTNLKIKISTIQNVNKPSSIKYYSAYNVDRICPDIYVNRDIALLQALSLEAKKNNIELELIVNEVCLYGDTPCNNLLRTACYSHSSLGGNPDSLFNNWPFERCQAERKKHPSCWLKIPYILPQYLTYYQKEAGIEHFKITGRTNTREYLLKIVQHYMKMEYNGKIHELFMLPNTHSYSDVDVYAEQLIERGFFDNLYRSISCDYRCDSCHYCDKYNNLLMPKNL